MVKKSVITSTFRKECMNYIQNYIYLGRTRVCKIKLNYW
ncbi:hypothetical protein BCAH1134_C0342 (plasmid) [Bacillus cereus AH1134]|nr:hypothetical protein BCAH1134_C0342 [Bacillus cereus AH1134]